MNLCPACEADTGRSDGVRCRECGHLFDDYCCCDFCTRHLIAQPGIKHVFDAGANLNLTAKAVSFRSPEDEELIERVRRYTKMPRDRCVLLLQEFDWNCERAIDHYWRNYILIY